MQGISLHHSLTNIKLHRSISPALDWRNIRSEGRHLAFWDGGHTSLLLYGVPKRRASNISAISQKEKESKSYLSSQEFFESFLRSRQASGDIVSKATDALWKLNDGASADVTPELREAIRERVAHKKAELQEGEGGFLKLSQAKSWTEGESVVAPANSVGRYEEQAARRQDRLRQGMLEYEALKRELLLLTAGVSAACFAYCVTLLSLSSAVSYGLGATGSYFYLQLLYKHVDSITEDDVPEVFMRRRSRTIGVTSQSVETFFQKAASGTSQALASPRLVIPGLLMGLWALSLKVGGEGGFHLELTPLLLGFVAYKGGALIQTYRDNTD